MDKIKMAWLIIKAYALTIWGIIVAFFKKVFL
jgi:hypothetical protein